MQFPSRAVRDWIEFEKALPVLMREAGRSESFATEIARRMKPLHQLLQTFEVDPVAAQLLEEPWKNLYANLLHERLAAEMVTCEELGFT